MYKIQFTAFAEKQYKRIKDEKYLNKLDKLFDDMIKHPKSGLGKPEKLKHELSGKWSRRIDKKNRLIYELIEPNIIIISVIGHY
jgi:toxin YoeB